MFLQKITATRGGTLNNLRSPDDCDPGLADTLWAINLPAVGKRILMFGDRHGDFWLMKRIKESSYPQTSSIHAFLWHAI